MSASVIASALLAAVNLSISKPSEYHFVSIPSEITNLLSGVGMKEEDGVVPLRYEDIAFLKEAFDERSNLYSSNATKTVVAANLETSPLSISVYQKFADPGLDCASSLRMIEGYGNRDAYAGIFGSTNAILPSFSFTPSFAKDEHKLLYFPLITGAELQTLYSELGKRIRVVAEGAIYTGKVGSNGYASEIVTQDYSNFTNYPPSTVASTGSPAVHLSYSHAKGLTDAYDGKGNPIKKPYETYDGRKTVEYCNSNPHLNLNILPYLKGRKATTARVYAVGHMSVILEEAGVREKDEVRWFVVPLTSCMPSGEIPNQIPLFEIGGSGDFASESKVFEFFRNAAQSLSLPFYASPDVVPTVWDSAQSNYYFDGYIDREQIYVVYDVEFNARVKADNEEDGEANMAGNGE